MKRSTIHTIWWGQQLIIDKDYYDYHSENEYDQWGHQLPIDKDYYDYHNENEYEKEYEYYEYNINNWSTWSCSLSWLS